MIKEPKTEIIKTTLTKTDRERLEKICAKYGRSISGWIREVIIKELDKNN